MVAAVERYFSSGQCTRHNDALGGLGIPDRDACADRLRKKTWSKSRGKKREEGSAIVACSFSLSFSLPIYLSIYVFTYLYIYLSIYLFIYLYIYISIYLSIYVFIYLYIYLFIYISVSIFLRKMRETDLESKNYSK